MTVESTKNTITMHAVASMAPNMCQERRIEMRTDCAIAEKGVRPSHQKAGSATTNIEAGQSTGTAANISAVPGRLLSSAGRSHSSSSG